MAAGQERRAMRCPYCNSEQGAGSASCSKCSFPFQEPEKQASFLQRKIRLAEAEESNTLELIGKSKYIIYAVALLIAIQTINIFSLLEAGGLLITIGIFSALLCCGMICLGLDMEKHPMRNAVLGLFGTFLAMSANKLGTLLFGDGEFIELLQTIGGDFIGWAAILVMIFCIYAAASYESRQNEVLRLKRLLALYDGTSSHSDSKRP